jgi:hypothetical protein
MFTKTSHSPLTGKYSEAMSCTLSIFDCLYSSCAQYRKFEPNIPRKGIAGHSPNFIIHVSVSDLYIPRIGLPILLQENMLTDPGNM